MPNLQKTSTEAPVFNTFNMLGTNMMLAFAGQIGFAYHGETGQIEDVVEVVNRKVDEADLIGHGTNNIPATADSPWIYVRTDDNNFFIKERTGAAEPYTYEYNGPYYEGSYESRIILSAADTPATPVPSWNAENATFNLTGGDWGVDTANAKWWRLVLLPKDSNVVSMSPSVRVGDPSAADITVDASGFDGNLNTTDTDMQRVAQAVDDLTVSGGGGSTQQPSDWDATSGVTRILNKPRVPQTFEIIPQDPNNILNSTDVGNSGRTVSGPFTINSDITTESSRYDLDIYVEANTQIELQETTGLTANLTFKFEILDASGTVVGSTDVPISTSGSSNAIGHARVFGNLPAGTERGSLRVTYVSRDPRPGIYQTLGVGWIRFFRGEIKSDIQADEVVIDPNAYGNNLRSDEGLDNVADALDQLDELPVAFADDEDIAWTASLNLDENPASNRQQTIPIDQLIQDSNERNRRQYVARINFHAAHSGGGSTIGYILDVHGDSTLLSSPRDTVNSTGSNNPFEIGIPSGTDNLIFTFKPPVDSGNNPISQGAARLTVTNFQISIMEGVDTTGFVQTGRITDHNDRSLQSIAEAVNAYEPPTGGGGGTDDQTAAEVTIDTSGFAGADNEFGGVLATIPGITGDIANVRGIIQRLNSLTSGGYNEFLGNQALDHGNPVSYSFTSNSGTAVRTNPLDIPDALQSLGVDVVILVSIEVETITSGFDGNIALVDPTTFNDLTSIDTERVRESGTTNVYANGERVYFARNIAASQVPDTFRVEFNRTSSSGNCTFNHGRVYFVADFGSASGSAAGATDSEWEVLWSAGPGTQDRRTASSSTHNLTLAGNRRFDQYRIFEIQYDNNNTAGIGLLQYVSYDFIENALTENLTGVNGSLVISIYLLYKAIKFINQTTFRIWQGNNEIGIRRLRGLR